MKAGLLTIAALSAVAIAQPHVRHAHFHEKRDVIVTATETDYVTEGVPGPTGVPSNQGDNNGNNGGNNAQAGKHEDAVIKQTDPPYNPAPTTTSSSTTSSAQQADNTGTSSGSSSGGSAGDGSTGGYGITYSPYIAGYLPKPDSVINDDYAKIKSEGYSTIRLYDTNENQIAQALSKASDNVKLLVGIRNDYVLDDGALKDQVSSIAKQVGNSWDRLDAIYVGNEGIANGIYNVDQVGHAIATVRSALKDAGFTGKVTTVDRFDKYKDNPGLCNVGDFIAANCHAYFTDTIEAGGAGKYVKEQADLVSGQCNGKPVTITESGWPTKGNNNGAAKPGTDEQSQAISSIKDAFSQSKSSVFLFSAFNNPEKDPGPYNVEQFWGIYGTSS